MMMLNFFDKKISKPFQLLKNNQNNTHVDKIESFTILMLQSPNRCNTSSFSLIKTCFFFKVLLCMQYNIFQHEFYIKISRTGHDISKFSIIFYIRGCAKLNINVSCTQLILIDYHQYAYLLCFSRDIVICFNFQGIPGWIFSGAKEQFFSTGGPDKKINVILSFSKKSTNLNLQF